MIPDWITACVAVAALCLSLYNIYTQRRDRIPRVLVTTQWVHPEDAPTAVLGSSGDDTAPSGKAIYRCNITNVGVAGVKITRVNVYPQAPPGKPISLSLPKGEESRKLDNGDSQSWSTTIEKPEDDMYQPDPRAITHVRALDTVGNFYDAKNPETFPYPYWF